MTLHRRWGDVVLTSCARWVYLPYPFLFLICYLKHAFIVFFFLFFFFVFFFCCFFFFFFFSFFFFFFFFFFFSFGLTSILMDPYCSWMRHPDLYYLLWNFLRDTLPYRNAHGCAMVISQWWNTSLVVRFLSERQTQPRMREGWRSLSLVHLWLNFLLHSPPAAHL